MYINLMKILILISISSILYASNTKTNDIKESNIDSQSKGFLELKNAKTVVSIGGRIQLDTLYSSPQGIHSAKAIPLETTGEEGQLDMSAKSSRFWIKTRTPSKYGVVRALIETDFTGVQGTETNTNSHNLRIRHAYVQVDGWTIGQTNSAFNAYVTLDLILIAINDTFVRQPLIRYSKENKNFSYDISFEQPETTLLDSTGTIITPKDDVLPDIVARIIHYPSWGDISLSILGRYITQDHAYLSDGTMLNNHDSTFGWGANFSGKIKTFGLDDIRFAIHYGLGIGRYLAYDAYPAGSINDNGDIKLQEAFGGDIGYLHWWNKELRSTIAISYAGTNNNTQNFIDLQKINKDVYSSQINLLWTPIPNSLIGVEYASAKRRMENNEEGTIKMITCLFRYDF